MSLKGRWSRNTLNIVLGQWQGVGNAHQSLEDIGTFATRILLRRVTRDQDSKEVWDDGSVYENVKNNYSFLRTLFSTNCIIYVFPFHHNCHVLALFIVQSFFTQAVAEHLWLYFH